MGTGPVCVAVSERGDSAMLEHLSPKPVFVFFEELTKIPRCSGDEKRVSDYLVGFAKERKLEVVQDKALNVIIKKAGTAGYEKSPAVIIQGHMDMVCEKSKASRHDFSKDPLKLKVDGDFVRAVGTTLGADNGIAVAYGLALLDSTDIPHPPIELLVTTSEETGMGGAAALKADSLRGKTLLNIDAENEGVFFVSCAGGVDIVSTFETHWEDATGKALLIEVSGLIGGHSGMEIPKQRANAIKLLGRCLDAARSVAQIHIAEISGGSKSNAIAREAQAVITAEAGLIKKITAAVEALAKDMKGEFAVADPKIEVTVSPAAEVAKQLDAESAAHIIDFLTIAPNGVQSMSKELEGLVESSLNLGVLVQSGESIKMTTSVRSSVASILADIVRRVEALAGLVGATNTRAGVYPAWSYEAESPVRDLCVKVYKDVTGHDAQIQAIHAGLECGLLKQKLPKTDMISFGPNLFNVHTTDEHLSVGSVANTWEFLIAVLAELK
jgi:dipeptidase D